MPLFDRKDKSRYATFTRRTLVMSGGMTMVLGALGGRLYQLQIRDGDQYRNRRRGQSRERAAGRAAARRILDRFGIELANNRRTIACCWSRSRASGRARKRRWKASPASSRSTIRRRNAMLRDLAAKQEIRARGRRGKSFLDEFALLTSTCPIFPVWQPDVGETRSYPFGSERLHLLGYVAPVSRDKKIGR